jgi:adenylate cyclase
MTMRSSGMQRHSAMPSLALYNGVMSEPASAPMIELPAAKGERSLSKLVRFITKRWKRITAIGALTAGVIAVVGHMLGGIAGLWEFYRLLTHADAGAASVKSSARPASPPRPFRSLVVLPFGADNEARDVANTLGTDLSRSLRRAYPEMSVTSTGLAQQYRAGARDPRKIGEDLSVRYVVDGNVRKVPDGYDMSVELIDSTDGSQVWSDRRTAPVPSPISESINRLRHDIRNAIVGATATEIRSLPEAQRQAWDLVLRANNEDWSIEGMKRSQRHFEEALRIDPDFAVALRGLSYTLWQRLQDEPEMAADLLKPLDDASARAVRVAPNDPRAWLARTHALRVQGNIDGAFAAIDQALKIDPLEASVLGHQAWLFIYAGRPQEALPILEWAMQIDASETTVINVIVGQCVAYFNLGRDKDALAPCERAAGLWQRWMIYAYPMVIYSNLGDKEKTAYWKAKLVAANPRVSIERFRQLAAVNSREPRFHAQVERMFAPFRKLGIPES